MTINSRFSSSRTECVYYGGNNTRCALIHPDFVFDQNPECFDEVDKANITRVYCGLRCEESDETTLLKKKPQWNHQCSMFYTYNLERRRRDWYLWRSGVCINTTMSFEILCGTYRDPRLFYFHNEHLFEYEDTQ
ncbi:hypothetical protein KIN20_007359 [Parelaphostrongylus tenuis]|uniref:DUF7808 domain-containing protein n=1 Tax=Parelaphostrongylus tenuis TaxID=148309 RepID=A0AAD5M6E3_PARTN|nr:hypothetical protein KIN20_007359 [Parelaphostrongylus tenuis]